MSARRRPVEVAEGPTILFDLAWDQSMDERQLRKIIPQLAQAYALNRKTAHPLPMVFAACSDRVWKPLFDKVNGGSWDSRIVQYSPEKLMTLYPAEKMVYLTADTDNVCTELDPSKVYIIGCILDHNSKKGATKRFADSHGIRTERLPISENITMEGREVLTINQVSDLLVRVGNGASWVDALMASIPPRKQPKAKIVQEEEDSRICDTCSVM